MSGSRVCEHRENFWPSLARNLQNSYRPLTARIGSARTASCILQRTVLARGQGHSHTLSEVRLDDDDPPPRLLLAGVRWHLCERSCGRRRRFGRGRRLLLCRHLWLLGRCLGNGLPGLLLCRHLWLLRGCLGNGLPGLGWRYFGRAIALGLCRLLQANAYIAAGADINETQIVVRDVLGAHDVRSDGEDDFGLLALLIFLSEEIL